MNKPFKYDELIDGFLDGKISVDEFQSSYLAHFKSEGNLSDELFEILDEFFGDVDSFTTDQHLLAEQPDFYLDEARLRERARLTASRLADFNSRARP